MEFYCFLKHPSCKNAITCSTVFTVKQHTAMADRQNNMIAHIRTMCFADQNRAIMFAMQT